MLAAKVLELEAIQQDHIQAVHPLHNLPQRDELQFIVDFLAQERQQNQDNLLLTRIMNTPTQTLEFLPHQVRASILQFLKDIIQRLKQTLNQYMRELLSIQKLPSNLESIRQEIKEMKDSIRSTFLFNAKDKTLATRS